MSIMQVMATQKPLSVTSVIPAIYIDANDISSYPGTGTSIFDLSGNGNTQTLALASQYTVLSGIKCFNCIGNDIEATVTGPVLPTTGFTYIIWARMRSSTADYRTLLRSLPSDHALLIQIGNNNLGMWDNTTDLFYSAGYNVSNFADVWAQWCVSGTSSGQTFYINGQKVGTTNLSVSGNSHKYLGSLGVGQSFGYVANMKLYLSLLTQGEILQAYLNEKSLFV